MPTSIRLTDHKRSDEKEQEFFNPENRYEAKQEDFSKIPASPIAYWVSEKIREIFENEQSLENITPPKIWMMTGNNDLNIEAKLKEVIAFDREKMMSVSQNPVEIDLDDGVKVNYCKFKDILYPIKGLCKK